MSAAECRVNVAAMKEKIAKLDANTLTAQMQMLHAELLLEVLEQLIQIKYELKAEGE
jgi:hypothetical protein